MITQLNIPAIIVLFQQYIQCSLENESESKTQGLVE